MKASKAGRRMPMWYLFGQLVFEAQRREGKGEKGGKRGTV
jgi:hypothetical protein